MSKQYLQVGWGGECCESECDGVAACQSSTYRRGGVASVVKVSVMGWQHVKAVRVSR
jgi:hypothetical protein